MKYEYLLKTWGGFYNKEYQDKHKEVGGYNYFETADERSKYLVKLRNIERRLNAKYLVVEQSEGYNTREITTLHRVVKFDGREYYTNYKIAPNYSYRSAKYHLENKWYLGFNDYPLGEDFDYENNDVKILQEWITGAFDIIDE